MASVVPPDLEYWLTNYIRSQISGIDASNKEPADLQVPLPRPLVVVRDDSGPKRDILLFDRSAGVSVLAGTKRDDRAANDLARGVFAVLTDPAIVVAPASPIAAVVDEGCRGPYAIDEKHDVARRYFTVEYTVVGQI